MSGGLPVPLTAAAALPAGAVVFPDQIVVFCDRCGTEAAHDYVVHDLMTREERLGVARAHLSADEGWSCTAYGDFCPACATTRPTGGNAAMADLRVQIHSHLRQHPWLTANEIGRMIGKHQATVRNTLRRMEADGEAVSRERPRTDGSGRMPAEWRAV